MWLPTARFVCTARGIAPGDSDSATFQVLQLSDIYPLDADNLERAGETAHDIH